MCCDDNIRHVIEPQKKSKEFQLLQLGECLHPKNITQLSTEVKQTAATAFLILKWHQPIRSCKCGDNRGKCTQQKCTFTWASVLMTSLNHFVSLFLLPTQNYIGTWHPTIYCFELWAEYLTLLPIEGELFLILDSLWHEKCAWTDLYREMHRCCHLVGLVVLPTTPSLFCACRLDVVDAELCSFDMSMQCTQALLPIKQGMLEVP